jgi:transcription termination/antitermination protein NusA
MEGLNPTLVVALGEAGVKTIEDLADCATDDLIGWNERKDGATTKHPGAFTGQDISATDAQALIMAARVKLGWIEAEPEAPATEEVAG